MSHIDFIIERVEAMGDAAVLGFHNRIASGKELGERIRASAAWLREQGVRQGNAVALVGDFSIDTVAIMMALIDAAAISIPLTPATLRASRYQTLPGWKARNSLRSRCHSTPSLYGLMRPLR